MAWKTFLTKAEALWRAGAAWEKQSPPQSMNLPTLLLLVLSKLWGFASYYVHIFVIFWSAYGFTFYGVCTTCCSLTLAAITAFPLEASTMLQHACKVPACTYTLLAVVKVSHRDSPAQSFLQWLTILFRDDSGVSPWGWQCSVRGPELASNEFTLVLTIAPSDTSLLGKLCSCLQYIHAL